MNPVESRELSVGELETVSGGRDGLAGYKFCWGGPAGDGLYPWYINCGGSLGESLLAGAADGATAGL